MSLLELHEKELVALGAAIASNCVPCIEYHVPEARKAGLCDGKIDEAIRLADKVRQVPARKVLAAARRALGNDDAAARSDSSDTGAPLADEAERAEPCCA